MTELIRVVLADDHRMVREALARVLNEEPGVEVIAQASDGPEIEHAVGEATPDVLVMDYSMPQLDPPRLIESLLQRHPGLEILVLTVHENIHYALRVLEAGAQGYLIKSAAPEELVEAIRAVRAGRIYLSSSIEQDVLHHLRKPRERRAGLEGLSPREFTLIGLLGSGRSLAQCASEMNVSVSTASTYRARILQKLGLDSTAALIRYAVDHGLSD